MKTILFIFLFLFVQKEPDTTKKEQAVIDKQVIDKIYSSQINFLDSIIATKQAEKYYNLNDTVK